MAIALVGKVSAGSAAGGDITTGAVNLTGADFLVTGDSYKIGGSGDKDSKDNQGNGTFTALTESSSGTDCTARVSYKAAPVVGASHTFTLDVSSSVTLPSIAGLGFSGVLQVNPFDVQNGATATAQSVATGSVTPTEAGSLLIAVLVVDRAVTGVGIGSGFTLAESVAFVTSQHLALYVAYLIHTTGAINPTWSWTTFANVAARIAVFKPAAVTPKSLPPIRRMNVFLTSKKRAA